MLQVKQQINKRHYADQAKKRGICKNKADEFQAARRFSKLPVLNTFNSVNYALVQTRLAC
jgi:hypothetical protein